MVEIAAGPASERILERLESLHKIQTASPGVVRARQFAEAVSAIQAALAEVEVVEEELRQQNEELIAAREALELERHRYRDLFDLAPDAYVLTDAHGLILEANQAAARLFDTPQAVLQGKPLPILVEREGRSRFRSLIGELRAGQRREDVEVRFVTHGKPRVVLITVARDEDKLDAPPRLRWILRDTSGREAAERHADVPRKILVEEQAQVRKL
jgi:PAS domain S-box-containing protein